jgi:hypothetical protein
VDSLDRRPTERAARPGMVAVSEPTENGDGERLTHFIKEEHIALTKHDNYANAHRQIGRFVDDIYPHKCVHSASGYPIPLEFECQWCKEQRDGAASENSGPKSVQLKGQAGPFFPSRFSVARVTPSQSW